MSWITEIPREEATGLLRRELDAAVERAGRVWKIVQVMSLNAPVLRATMEQYAAIMFGPSPLSRFQRELLATVVSAELDCFY
ncbi:MAG: peroxidase [Gemmatimonadetes bacterium]|nr:peroxidase [Gemmatimonadota bacterium]MDE2677601.1 peroxidase [Gemmatimonadota bacterium]MXX35524.1 peroxidase [Gemmatimonadota bacterium]MYA11553.1 peroxidase [Gemmatimonadota bacterium]MYD13047.1 peroxidase [Gemmatimonadota bacterium]